MIADLAEAGRKEDPQRRLVRQQLEQRFHVLGRFAKAMLQIEEHRERVPGVSEFRSQGQAMF